MTSVGLIGCGYWGPNYARIFNELDGAEFSWACDRDPAALSEITNRHPDVRTATELDNLLADETLDAVVVATPAHTHAAIIRQALEAGKHVLAEKPLTTSSKDSWELGRLADAKGLTLMVGHVFEHNAGVHRMREYLASGELGEPHYLYFTRTGLGPIRHDVNVVWDLIPHDVSIILHLLDGKMPSEVHAHGAAYIQPGREDVVFATLRYDDGLIAHIHASWLDPHKIRRATVIGSEKMLVFDDVNQLEPIRVYSKGADLQSKSKDAPLSYGDFQVSLRDGDILIPKVRMLEPLRAQAQHFLHCIATGERPSTDSAQGARVVEVCERIQEALGKQAG